MLRVVLDTNVFVSALLGKGPPAKLYEAFRNGEFELICSKPLLTELADVLLRPELDIPPNDVKAAFRLLRQHAVFARPKHHLSVCRDPKDNRFLESALSGAADFLVTGDRDLLALDPFRRVRIVSPTIFIRHLRS